MEIYVSLFAAEERRCKEILLQCDMKPRAVPSGPCQERPAFTAPYR